MAVSKLPTVFISHGGGPWPYIPELREKFSNTVHWLTELPKTFPQKPKAILSISGHWEEEVFTVSTAQSPPMVYDYGGFPEYTYHIQYPAPGSPELASHVHDLIEDAGMSCAENPHRGLDHGTFVPLSVMYPEADIPVVTLSVKSSYDPYEHLRMGRALRSLREEGVLIIGSGLCYHTIQALGEQSGTFTVSHQFSNWLRETVTEPNFQRRTDRLLHWEEAPAARMAHPKEDHLIPLMVVVGAAEFDLGEVAFVDHVSGIELASYEFGLVRKSSVERLQA